jgi:chromosomal replication initiation ATPase DnaA
LGEAKRTSVTIKNRIMTKKIEKEIILYAQSELINSFINTLNFNTKEQYRQVVNALALDDVYTKQETKNFIKYLFETPKREDKLKLIDS